MLSSSSPAGCGCTGDTAREIRHLLNAWSEQNGYDETRCAVNRHAWQYYIACMLAHAVRSGAGALARRAYGCLWLSPRLARGHASSRGLDLELLHTDSEIGRFTYLRTVSDYYL